MFSLHTLIVEATHKELVFVIPFLDLSPFAYIDRSEFFNLHLDFFNKSSIDFTLEAFALKDFSSLNCTVEKVVNN